MSLVPSRSRALSSAVIAVGLAGFVMGMTLFWGFVTLAVVAGVGAALLSMLVAWLSLTLFASESGATRFCIFGSVIAGVLNVYFASTVVSAISGENWIMESVFPDMMRSSASALVFGAPPGLVFGAVFVLPIRRVHNLYRSRAVEAADRASKLCGGWLAMVCAGCFAIDAMTLTAVESGFASRPFLLGTIVVVGLFGAAAFLIAHLRISIRRRWFERVQAGHEAGWTIVPRSLVAEELDDLQSLFVSSATFNVVLVQHESVEGGGAYRTASNLIPRALIHLPEGLAAMSFSLPNEEERLSTPGTEMPNSVVS